MNGSLVKKGTVLITTVIILSFLGLLGLALSALITSRNLKANLELERLKALYLAEAAISLSIYELKHDLDLDRNGVGNVVSRKLGEGHIEATHNFQTSTIIGQGKVNDVVRKVQIRYRSL